MAPVRRKMVAVCVELASVPAKWRRALENLRPCGTLSDKGRESG